MASHVNVGSASSAKSPVGGTRGASGGSGSAGIPSPATFAHMAAGVQETLLDESSLAAAASNVNASTPSSSSLAAATQRGLNAMTTSADVMAAAAALQTMDPFSTLMYNVEHFANVQVKQLQEASTHFFDLFENATDASVDANAVLTAHSSLLSTIDQLIASASQGGFAGLAMVEDRASSEDTHMHDAQASKPMTDLTAQSRITFERRQRLHESASMVTNILTHS